MVGVYNLGSQLEADSIFTIHCIHDYASQINSVQVIVDTNYAWTNAWQNMQTTTSNAQLNQLLGTYGFTLSSFSTYTIGNHLAILESPMALNLERFCDSFNSVINGAYSLTNNVAGTETD